MADLTFERPNLTVRDVPMTAVARINLGDALAFLIDLNKRIDSPEIDRWIDGHAALISAYDQAYEPREWVA